MTINQLKYIVAISRSSSMREASESLYITQPALTAALAELEEELGILLFERTNKGTALTDEGREFLIYAKKALGQYQILEDRYLSKGKDKERFSVSSQHYNFAVDAFAALVRETNPGRYAFSFHETRTGEVLEHVRSMKSEVGIISYSAGNQAVMEKLLKNSQLEFVPLMRRETYAYLWKAHPLANKEMLSLEQLRDYPCISFEQSENDNDYLQEEALSNAEFDKLIKSDDRATTMELIAKTGGYSIGSGMLSEEGAILDGLVAVKLEEEDPLTIGYILRKNAKLSEYGMRYVEKLEQFRELN